LLLASFASALNFYESPTVKKEVAAVEKSCGKDVLYGPEALYSSLDRVLLFRWNGLVLNGPGNTLGDFTRILATGAHFERATFSERNVAFCGEDGHRACASSPGTYFAVAGPKQLTWEWTPEVAKAVKERHETMVEFSTEEQGFLRQDTGAVLPVMSLVDLLKQAQDVPFVVVSFKEETSWAFDYLVEGRHRNEAWIAYIQMDQQKIPERCSYAPFLAASPYLQRLVLPSLTRVDSVKAAGGGVVGIHVRSGYADHTPDPLVGKMPNVSLEELETENWSMLDYMYATCGDCPQCKEDAQLAQQLGVVKPEVCWRWNDATHDMMRDTRLAIRLGHERGLFSTLVNKAVQVASATAPDHWLIYLAGDLPVLGVLFSKHNVLGPRHITGPGAHGHVSKGETCKLDRRGERVCLRGVNPGGSWDRTYVDMWMLASVDEIVRFGATSFVNAVFLRVHWPMKETLFAGELIPPNNVLHAQLFDEAHQLSDVMVASLNDALIAVGRGSHGNAFS
jgi:hypothetical protein